MTRVLLFIVSILSVVSLDASDYYWIGGSGNWSDLSHWATTSGGNVTFSQIPSSEDDIFFDANSFTADGQTVTFNNDIVFFRNLSFDGNDDNVTLTGGRSVIISCFGSFDLGASSTFEFDGIITFNGSLTDNVVNFGSNDAGREIYFSGDGGWTLAGLLIVDSILQFNSGNFSSGSHEITTQYFNILSDEPKNLNFGSSLVYIWGEYGEHEYNEQMDTVSARINTNNLTIDPGTSEFTFDAMFTELRYTGSGDMSWYNVFFNDPDGRTYIRQFDGDSGNTWNNVTFNGSARIEGDHNMAELFLSGDKVYRFESGRLVSLESIDATGTCSQGIIITSSQAGEATRIDASTDINLDFVTLRDIQSTGASFTATNSTDLGNNNGWTFTNSTSVDFYWIGGSGNWNDPNSWSLTSGGPSSGCVPTGKDRAFFDGGSFTGPNDSVSINLDDIFIKDMIWNGFNGNPALVGPRENNIHITGSLEYDQNMDHRFQGNYFFESLVMGNSISLDGIRLNQEVTFSGVTAGWTILDDFYSHETFTHNSGSIIAAGVTLDLWKYLSPGRQSRALDITGSYIILHSIAHVNGYEIFRPEWQIETTNFVLDAEQSTIDIRSGYYAFFFNHGEDILSYNKVIFNSYGGEFRSQNYAQFDLPIARVDSLIYTRRGIFWGYNDIGYLKLTEGYDYRFSTFETTTIEELDANGTCGMGVIDIASSEPGRPAQIVIENDHTLDRIMVQDMEQLGNGTLTVNNAIDQGNNTGWIFNESTSRTLYWVGNTGEWEDSTHWSLNSGGMGGECIPTAIDDVIFDENSFDLVNQAVYSNATRLNSVRDMTWRNVFGNPTFGHYYDPVEDINFATEDIKIFGSLNYGEGMNLTIFTHSFYTEESDSVFTNGNTLYSVRMNGEGSIYFMDDNLNAFHYNQNRGISHFNDINVQYNNFSIRCYSPAICEVHLGKSHITLGRNENDRTNFEVLGDRITFFADSSSIEVIGIDNYLVMADSPVSLNRVTTTNPSGSTFIGNRFPQWQKPSTQSVLNVAFISFAGNGTIYGQANYGTIIGSPGKTYILESNETQTIRSYLQMIGNNCTPIQLLSSNTGDLASIRSFDFDDFTHLVDFVEMRDINATGREFIAGARSTDIAMSNRGWLFEDPPEFVETGFLGVDRTLCQASEVELSAFNFSIGEQYLWSDGSTDTTLNVSSTGVFNVTVTFDNGCEVSDEIIILEPQDIVVDLPGDTLICEGNVLQLIGNIGIQGVDYVWQDSLRVPNRDVTTAGEYILSAEVDGCTTKDSLIVSVQPTPELDLGNDQTLCENETTILDATIENATYLWQDNTTDATIEVSTQGTYTVATSINGCTLIDSVTVDFIALPVVDLGNDTILCDGEILRLEAPALGIPVRWQDGSTMLEFESSTSGTYSVEVDDRGCISADTIEVVFQVPPVLELGDTKAACDGEDISITPNVDGDNYLWNNGATSREISVSTAGTYTLSITDGACTVTDDVEVVLSTFPVIDIGSDTTLCEDSPISLSFNRNNDFQYNWQDGTDRDVQDIISSGIYSLTADNNGCVTIDSVTITFDTLPTLDLGGSQAICDGEQALLMAGVAGDSFAWSDGATTPDISVSAPGSYTLTVVAGTCTVTDDVEVVVSTFPIVALGNDTLICEGEELTLQSTQDPSYVLQWQDGSTGNSFTVSEEGTYTFSADNNGCVTTDEIVIEYQVAPQLDLGGDQQACEGDVITISTAVNADSYQWSDGTTTPTISAIESGAYSLTVTQGVCQRQESVNINFNAFPTVDLGPAEASICDKDVLTLTTSQEGIWQDGSMTDVFEASTPGLYHVLLSNNGCETRDSVMLEVRSLPVVDLGADQTLCDGETATISSANNLVEFAWEDGSDDVTRDITTTGTYWLEAVENNCSNRDSVSILFNSLPTLSLGLDTTVCADSGYEINAIASDGIITWQDGTIGDRFNVTTPGTITATIDNGCLAEAAVDVNFRECFYFDMYVPNAFNPNSARGNNLFRPSIARGIQVLSYNMNIYNRWGNLLFSTQSPDQGWNGTINNANTQSGVYVYTLNISYLDDNGLGEETRSGDVIMIE